MCSRLKASADPKGRNSSSAAPPDRRPESDRGAPGGGRRRRAPGRRKLAASLNVTATVYGADAKGEFVYGVFEASDGAGEATSPVIKRLFAEIGRRFAVAEGPVDRRYPRRLDSRLRLAGRVARLLRQPAQAGQASGAPQIGYATLFRIFCGDGEPGMLSLPANEATLALLSRRLWEMPGWLWLTSSPASASPSSRRSTRASRPERSPSISTARCKCCGRAPCFAASRRERRNPCWSCRAHAPKPRRLRPRQRRTSLSRSRRSK